MAEQRVDIDAVVGEYMKRRERTVAAALMTGVHHALNPDQCRGVFGSHGVKYAKDCQDIIDYGTCGRVAGFILEAIQSVGGTLELAPKKQEAFLKLMRFSWGLLANRHW
ncbi:hypothetical protein L1049_014267 [Liquidambar formosana]|uniref:Uncharacterized protein n=1 Tax=Liquidambar formosana TaxID=63359 RepID=A0AAP0RLZ5_LIQFO